MEKYLNHRHGYSSGNIKIVKMLIDADTIQGLQDEDGQIPYDLAKIKEMKTILQP
jgi:hypothetical protein